MSTRILVGDVRERLRELSDASVHCVVTSPPYYNLRDYQTAAWDGGDPACDHLKPPTNGAVASSRLRNDGREHVGPYDGEKAVITGKPFGATCGKCGATRVDRQIGLEETPAAFVAVMVEVFRDVKRVLRDDGVLFLNLGDSYAGSWGAQSHRVTEGDDASWHGSSIKNHPKRTQTGSIREPGLKPKDLIGIPWRVAFALQADGWWLRQDIIWAKSNPMPESVTDRCTKAHEYLFLLTKNARYYFDAAAIAEPAIYAGDVKTTNGNDGMDAGFDGHRTRDGFRRGVTVGETRNRRSVWTVATHSFAGAHFATFPPALIEPCILAGCPRDCCAKCGAPVVREVERIDNGRNPAAGRAAVAATGGAISGGTEQSTLRVSGQAQTTGWSPSCTCNAGLARGVCLDPFFGAGTTGLVADRLGRDCIGVELSPEYAAIAERRIKGDSPLFAEVAA